jgi:DNA replication protein DnaC
MNGAAQIEKNCETHGPYVANKTGEYKGRFFYSPCPKCKELEDKEKAKFKEEGLLIQKYKAARECGIPEKFKKCSFDQYIQDNEGQQEALYITSCYANEFLNNKRAEYSLILFGNRGTGKTMLACCIAMQVVRNGFSAKYTSVLKISGEIKGTFSKDSPESQFDIISKYASYDLLVLDEIGVGQKNSDWELGVLFEIINSRYENLLPTVVISNISENLSPNENPNEVIDQHLTKHLGPRVVDRLLENEGGRMYFDWDTYRKKTYNQEYL